MQQTNQDTPARGPLGKRRISHQDAQGSLWVAQQMGGKGHRHSEGELTLSLALYALYDALEMFNVVSRTGPLPVVVMMPEPLFLRLRDALVEMPGFGRDLFKTHSSRVRIDATRRSFMLHGITVAAGEPEEGLDLTCPRRRRNKPAATAQG